MYGHVITTFSAMGRFTYLWGFSHLSTKRARGAPLLISFEILKVGTHMHKRFQDTFPQNFTRGLH